MSDLRFDITLHPAVAGIRPGEPHRDELGLWPTIIPPAAAAGATMALGFDDALERLATLERMFVEPDGSFVWVGPGGEGRWQVDGNAWERDGRVGWVEVRGSCPTQDFDRFLAAWGWPTQPFTLHLVRAGVFVDEPTFRRHAAAAAVG